MEVEQFLFEDRADAATQDQYGWCTPLHLALDTSSADLALFLVVEGRYRCEICCTVWPLAIMQNLHTISRLQAR